MSRLIVIEGPDGSGKSTLSSLLQKELLGKGISVTLFREPGDTPLGERVRGMLKDKQLEMNPRSETLLFCAARAELATKIREQLKESWVILDRYEGSTLVYQGLTRNLGTEEVLSLSRWASDDLVPDINLVLLLEEERSTERRSSRAEEDRMEKTTNPGDVLLGYKWLSEQPGYFPVSAEGTPDEALREAISTLEKEIGLSAQKERETEQ